MKRFCLGLLFVSMLFLASCNEIEASSRVTDIEYEGAAIEDFEIGVNQIGDFNIKVSYDNGFMKSIPLTESMIDSMDVFNQNGFEDVVITYESLSITTSFKIYESEHDKLKLNIYQFAINSSATNLSYTEWLLELEEDAGVSDYEIESAGVNAEGYLVISFSNGNISTVGIIVDFVVDSIYHTVTFYDFTNTYITDIQVIKDGSFALLNTPELPNGMIFTGWSESLINISEDIDVYPLYSHTGFEIEFHGNNGIEYSDEINIDYGSSVELPVPEKVGYTFVGWFTGETVNDEQFSNESQITSSLVLFARWETEIYYISYSEIFGGTSIPPRPYLYGDNHYDEHLPTKDGYFFQGWFLSDDFIYEFDYNGFIEEDTVLYPKYVDIDYVIDVESDFVTITGYTGDYTHIKIPSEIEGYTVEVIGQNAFKNATFETISIPNTVIEIKTGAFEECSNLHSITIPDSVVTMGTRVFYNDIQLSYVKLSSNLSIIPERTFYENRSLLDIDLHDNITEINDYAFMKSGLTSLDLPDSLQYIDLQAFAYTHISSLVINEGLVELGLYAFEEIEELESIHISSTVSGYDNSFDDLNGLLSLTIEDSSLHFTVVDNVLYSKDMTTLYYYPESKTDTSFTIPSTVENLGKYAIDTNEFLTVINIPDTFTMDAMRYNFYNLVNIQEYIIYDNGGGLITGLDGVIFNSDMTTLMKYPIGKTDTSYNVPSSVVIIGREAFSGAVYLENMIIPEGVLEIQTRAFVHSNITTFSLPSTLTTFGTYVFAYCKNLTTIEIPASVVKLGDSLFAGSTNLEEIILNEGLLEIGGYFFESTNVTQLIIPASVTSISHSAFYYNRNLETVTITEGNQNYISDEFGVIFNIDMTTLTHYIIGVTETRYVVPESVTYIDGYVWQNDYLEELIIGSNVTLFETSGRISMPNLNSITFLNDTSGNLTVLNNDIFTAFGSSLVIYVPQTVLTEYENSTFFSNHTDIIEPIPE